MFAIEDPIVDCALDGEDVTLELSTHAINELGIVVLTAFDQGTRQVVQVALDGERLQELTRQLRSVQSDSRLVARYEDGL